jgi:hypothetical protein
MGNIGWGPLWLNSVQFSLYKSSKVPAHDGYLQLEELDGLDNFEPQTSVPKALNGVLGLKLRRQDLKTL